MPYRGKRGLDLLLVLITALAWIPLLLVTALLVRVKLGGPVFFRQRRVGLKGAQFEILKFRTMTDARDAAGQLLPDEQRMTPFGTWLRATSLDELPELFNVLRGELSLVGPRPLLVQYLPLYSAEHARRHEVAPGLTGLAQTSGRNALSWPDRFDMDVYYVDHVSFGLDMRILFKTILAVLGRKGITSPGEATMPYFTGYAPTRARDIRVETRSRSLDPSR